ncbi:MAG: hypothetical protein KatS3mg110_4063 [Pirellulaceae bacterium]|nr:MAG: hypothetical protein KatS3mg110_4063 [Pirellulaceae bacterium]
MTVAVLVLLPLIDTDFSQVSSRYGPSGDLCCVACAKSLLEFYGKKVSVEEVRRELDRCAAARAPYPSLADICCCMKAFGMKTRVVKVPRWSISLMNRPAILYLRPERVRNLGVGHVILLREVYGDCAEIVEFSGGLGVKRIPLEQLFRYWDGEAIVVGFATGWYVAGLLLMAGGLAGVGWTFCRARAKKASGNVVIERLP